jgi:hypothetical protein
VTTSLAMMIAMAIAAPHVLDLRTNPPVIGAAVWFASLAVRGLVVVAAAGFALVYLPQTDFFSALAHWCLHAVVPFLAAHLGLDGHRVADAVIVLPASLLVLSFSSGTIAIVRAARLVRSSVSNASLGTGPEDSILVGGSEVVLASAGLARPRVIVSAGALLVLDDDELAAGLAHERGHIARRHHHVLCLAEIMQAVGRFVPGSGRALSELRFHLERDADRWAISERHDPLALASAICKAADGSIARRGVAALGGGRATDRVDELMTCVGPEERRRRRRRLAAPCLAVCLSVLAIGLAVAIPLAVAAGVPQGEQRVDVRHCVI